MYSVIKDNWNKIINNGFLNFKYSLIILSQIN